jgi:hypothetical protein
MTGPSPFRRRGDGPAQLDAVCSPISDNHRPNCEREAPSQGLSLLHFVDDPMQQAGSDDFVLAKLRRDRL